MATYMLFLLGWERSLEYFQLRGNGGGMKTELVHFYGFKKLKT